VLLDVFGGNVGSWRHGSTKDVGQGKMAQLEFVARITHQGLDAPQVKKGLCGIQMSAPCSVGACLNLGEEEQAHILKELLVWSELSKTLDLVVQDLGRACLVVMEQGLVVVDISVFQHSSMQHDQT
jgi:hypothetical protein